MKRATALVTRVRKDCVAKLRIHIDIDSVCILRIDLLMECLGRCGEARAIALVPLIEDHETNSMYRC